MPRIVVDGYILGHSNICDCAEDRAVVQDSPWKGVTGKNDGLIDSVGIGIKERKSKSQYIQNTIYGTIFIACWIEVRLAVYRRQAKHIRFEKVQLAEEAIAGLRIARQSRWK